MQSTKSRRTQQLRQVAQLQQGASVGRPAQHHVHRGSRSATMLGTFPLQPCPGHSTVVSGSQAMCGCRRRTRSQAASARRMRAGSTRPPRHTGPHRLGGLPQSIGSGSGALELIRRGLATIRCRGCTMRNARGVPSAPARRRLRDTAAARRPQPLALGTVPEAGAHGAWVRLSLPRGWPSAARPPGTATVGLWWKLPASSAGRRLQMPITMSCTTTRCRLT